MLFVTEKPGKSGQYQGRPGKERHGQRRKPQPPFAPPQLFQVDCGGLPVVTRGPFQGGLGRQAYPVSELRRFCSVRPAKHIPQFRPLPRSEAIPKRYRPFLFRNLHQSTAFEIFSSEDSSIGCRDGLSKPTAPARTLVCAKSST